MLNSRYFCDETALKMKKLITFLLVFASALFAEAETLESPNGRLKMNFQLEEGGIPTYTLSYDGKLVIGKSRMGFRLDNSGLYDYFEMVRIMRESHDDSWSPVWGEESLIRNHCNELYVCLRQTSSNRYMALRFRLFDDGLGFRYEFPDEGNLVYFVIRNELTEFAMTGDHKAWWIPGDYDTQEYDYTESRITEIQKQNLIYTFVRIGIEFIAAKFIIFLVIINGNIFIFQLRKDSF